MAPTPVQQFCAHLRGIVELLERGDRGAAAEEADKLQALIGSLPMELSASELQEASSLVERFGTLGEQLRQETLASMSRLGTVRRLAAYGRR